MLLLDGVVIFVVTFTEVSAPDPPLGVAIRDKHTLHAESCTGNTPLTLDGTTAPQGGLADHGTTSVQTVTSTMDVDGGSSSSAAGDSGAAERLPSAAEDPATCLIGLLRETGQGSREAFAEFYRRTSRRVFGMVRRVVPDPGLSEEVTQEVFIAVWRDAATYHPGLGSPAAWLLTIAHRKAVDKVRSHRSSINRDEPRTGASRTRPNDEVAASVPARSDTLRLRPSMAALSPLQREAIVLAYFGSLTYREAAERLSQPLPSIKSRIRDGLTHLREQLDPA
ncbi:RNA polymerase, sigma-24 subunit, ECF subfamily [Pseudarthrobacter chlorophenolicus A6]|uniref:RNA polymerase sigma factor n=3 Tax=Pseudarthrobacter chlorophenolicus TaxID=85085 RepID=B8H6V9_PSECP|nr:RNA polymerase, sigma-24 subunit, ECF subfamily [Pseudarthrobacter chlorophenolicus A6]SDQ95538.1 RNA polymerase sigma-70 factor, ECF subfamily [Pseudarthrobacter chlorophenolicus]